MSDLPQYQNLINGKLCAPNSGRYLDSDNPATGEIWAQVPASDASDVDAAVEAAAAAFPAWSAMIPFERAFFLKAIGDLFLEHGEELCELETRDNGFPCAKTKFWVGIGMQMLWHQGRRPHAGSRDGSLTSVWTRTCWG